MSEAKLSPQERIEYYRANKGDRRANAFAITKPIRIGDLVESSISFAHITSQYVRIDKGVEEFLLTEDEIRSYGHHIAGNPMQGLAKLASRVEMYTPTEHPKVSLERWRAHMAKEYDFTRAVHEDMVTCFHRSVLLTLLGQQLDNDRYRVLSIDGFYSDSPFEQLHADGHLWNNFVVFPERKIFLVDSANMDGNGTPVVADISDVEELIMSC